jgi:hypothetical protein
MMPEEEKTHEQKLSEKYGTILQPKNNDAEVDAALSGDKPRVDIEALQTPVEDDAPAEKPAEQAPWFYAFTDSLNVHARWAGNDWEVTVLDGTVADQKLDPRKRNLLQRALKIALRRFENQRRFSVLSKFRKSEAQRQREIQEALAKSEKEGNLSLTPATKIPFQHSRSA